MTYSELIDELNKNGVNTHGEVIYEYEFYPLKDLFQLFWENGQSFLESEAMSKHFTKPRLYFSTTTDENAAAYPDGEYSLIVICKGAIQSLYSYYQGRKEGFNTKGLEIYNQIAARFDITPDYYLFQIVSLFFLYHETGHLIQQNYKPQFFREFRGDNCAGRVEESHVKEFDADWFASNELAFHIVGWCDEFFGSEPSKEKIDFLHKSTELALAGIYVLLIRWSRSEPRLYYDYPERCHPHPSVRLTYIFHYYVDTVKVMVPFQLDGESILRNAIAISTEIMKDVKPDPIEQYSKEIYENRNDIAAYVKKIIADCAKYPECCYNRLPNA